ncbi:MAG: cbb3-type cytochrome c oxidase subunit I [Candidatus Nitrosocosmicus sp.]
MSNEKRHTLKQYASLPQYDISPELKKLVLRFMAAMIINFVVLGAFAIGMRILQADIPIFHPVDTIPHNVLFYQLLTAHGQGMVFGVISANTMWFGYYAISKWGRKPLVGLRLAQASLWILESSIVLIVLSAAMGFGAGWYDLMPLTFLSGREDMSWGDTATFLFLLGDLLVAVFLTLFCIVIIATALKGKIASGGQEYEDKEFEQRDDNFYNMDDNTPSEMSDKMENLPSGPRWISLLGIGSWFPKKLRSKIPAVPIIVVAAFVTALVQIVGNPGLFLQVFQGFAYLFNLSDQVNWFVVKDFWWFFAHPIVYFPILIFLGAAYFFFSTSYGHNRAPYDKWNFRPWPFYFIFSILVFNHHLFMDMPLPTWMGMLSSVATLGIVFPSGLTIATLLHHIFRNKITWNVTAKFLIVGIMGWAFGGFQGATTGIWGTDVYQHNTMALPGHIHFMMLAGALTAAFGVLYAIIPDLTKKQMNRSLAEIHFWGTVIGIFALAFLFTFIGMDGAVRREANMPSAYDWAMPWLLSFALLIGITQFVFVYNFFYTLKRKPTDDETKQYEQRHKKPNGMGILPASD